MVSRVDTSLAYEKGFDACVKEFSTLFEFEITDLEGTLKIIESYYAKTKASVLTTCS